jgi:hypothetical protein
VGGEKIYYYFLLYVYSYFFQENKGQFLASPLSSGKSVPPKSHTPPPNSQTSPLSIRTCDAPPPSPPRPQTQPEKAKITIADPIEISGKENENLSKLQKENQSLRAEIERLKEALLNEKQKCEILSRQLTQEKAKKEKLLHPQIPKSTGGRKSKK